MKKLLLIILGIIVVVISFKILFSILWPLVDTIIYLSIIIIIVGGAFLILRKIFRG